MSKSQKTTKKSKVLSALKSGKGVTRKTALAQYKVVNLRATIADLRNNDGYSNIKTVTTKNGEVKYTMA
jgi:hypothetical protein